MSKMAELDWEIELRVCEGMKNGAIAEELNIPISMVEDWHKSVNLEWEEAFPRIESFSLEDVEYSPYGTINS